MSEMILCAANWYPRQPKLCVWTPVSEGLPEHVGRYAITTTYTKRSSHEGRYVDVWSWNPYDHELRESWKDVIAWAPLPEPYCGGEIVDGER